MHDKHILIVGGTGMLKQTVLMFAEQNCKLSVIARHHSRMNQLLEKAGAASDKINPMIVDYLNLQELDDLLEMAIEKFGRFSSVISWIHGPENPAHITISGKCESSQEPIPYYILKGSASYNPKKVNSELTVKLAALPNIALHEIILGFMVEGTKSRWLTNREISMGTFLAVQNKFKSCVIGQIEPWELKP